MSRMIPKQPGLEWRVAYAINRAAEQRAGAGKWPDMRHQCIDGALSMLEHSRELRASGRLVRKLPR